MNYKDWKIVNFAINQAMVTIIIIIIIEHFLKHISLTVHQISRRYTLIDMIINRHIKFNMLKT